MVVITENGAEYLIAPQEELVLVDWNKKSDVIFFSKLNILSPTEADIKNQNN